jgi:3D (Asp-Asp-Asp) domain-containing protein
MKNSTLLGSAVSVLLGFSVITYSRTYIQNPGSGQQPNQTAGRQQPNPAVPATEADATAEKPLAPGTVEAPKSSALAATNSALTYTATAYSLRGRTASGRPVARGVIAADPRVLPLGTRVRIDAGEYSGEYVVADTGGLVKGRRIDIWIPTSHQAMRFGRRTVKLTVLEYGNKRGRTAATRPTTSVWVPNAATPAQPTTATKK